jgi:MoxR-like ATPase
MRFSQIKQSIVSQFSQDRADANKTVFFILGAPGGGKSACAREALRDLGYTSENTVEFVASLRDPVDVLGTPNNNGDFTKWVPPEEFYKLRQGVGKCALLLEELSDAPVPMQNALCGVIYDRRAGQLQLSDELVIIATGNRTEDKSGANRITSKLAGRTRRLDFSENLEELTQYALDAGWPTELIQYLRFKPDAVMDFEPNRFQNATPRTWEDVARMNPGLSGELELDNIAGSVGAGRAAEYVGFKQIYNELPDITEILMNPAKAIVPENLAARYAVMGAVARKASADNFENVCTYIGRFQPEFEVTCVKDAIKLAPAIKRTRAFQSWAAKSADVLI